MWATAGRRTALAVVLLLLAGQMSSAQLQASDLRVEPPNWWTGMQRSRLQLLIHAPGIAEFKASLDNPGVRLTGQHTGSSPNYLFLDLEIGPEAEPGLLELQFELAGKLSFLLPYPLQQRERPGETYLGFDTSDAIYLITPDRFANGDPGNDSVPGMRETAVDRSEDYGRHGGDIRGIRDHLGYIAEMGFTAIWPTPLLENDMPATSYHGYAITDHYRVDPRFGTLEDYKTLAREASALGIKLIMDQVVNHCGLYHWWMEDLPFPDWIHYQEAWQRGQRPKLTNHRRTVNQDLYASKADRELMDQGWFVPSMPDLNQKNPFLANYLIQNSIWWVETLGLGGIRQDTYPYPDKGFLSEWARALMEEYPRFNIVGEEWSYNPLLVGYWQDGAQNGDGYRSYLRTVMDFPLQRALIRALTTKEEWESGLNLLYQALANDFHYSSPENLLFFGDNHDMDRLFTQLGESEVLAEMALAFLLSVPRIPQIYYGTEILLENTELPEDHGRIRSDFPGGWKGDSVNAFTGKGLRPGQRNMQRKLRRLLNYRKHSQALQSGRTLHFAPQDGVYLLARQTAEESVLLILNKNKKAMQLQTSRFAELGLGGEELTDLISGRRMSWADSLSLDREGAYLLTTRLLPE